LPVAYWDNGAHVYTANKPLIRPEDFRGLKMRIQGSRVLDAVARQLGAIPQIMAFSELYQALQTGVVDGEDNVPSNIWTQKYYEVQKHLTVSYHGRLTYALVTNNKFWVSLPADVRGELDRAVKESTDYFNSVAEIDNADALEKIKASGKIQVHVLTDAEKKAWVAKLMPVHKEMQSRFGKDFIDKIYKASGFVAPQS
jgi:C4-dicarboxylate-binding protein DctP